ncbi:hypothetical protein ACFYP0_25375 [Micromonospora arida]|uniref:hypothetical protein n=1 Tax=Micromonospora arida TaxID=2203715 RepID=UPI0036821DEA
MIDFTDALHTVTAVEIFRACAAGLNGPPEPVCRLLCRIGLTDRSGDYSIQQFSPLNRQLRGGCVDLA